MMIHDINFFCKYLSLYEEIVDYIKDYLKNNNNVIEIPDDIDEYILYFSDEWNESRVVKLGLSNDDILIFIDSSDGIIEVSSLVQINNMCTLASIADYITKITNKEHGK